MVYSLCESVFDFKPSCLKFTWILTPEFCSWDFSVFSILINFGWFYNSIPIDVENASVNFDQRPGEFECNQVGS